MLPFHESFHVQGLLMRDILVSLPFRLFYNPLTGEKVVDFILRFARPVIMTAFSLKDPSGNILYFTE